MAKKLITIKSGIGLTGIIDELTLFSEKMPEITLTALKAKQSVLEDAIRASWVSEGGTQGGFVYSSVGQSTAYSKRDKNTVVGTVGVYDLDAVRAKFGRTDKDLTAAQIAYWVEYGTSRLKNRGRKKRGKQYPESMLVPTAPRPFISSAVYGALRDSDKAFAKKFNEEYERLMK